MRIKTVAVVTLIGIFLSCMFLLALYSARPEIDTQFNVNRVSFPSNPSDSTVFPQPIGDFQRQAVESDFAANPGSNGSAKYSDHDGKEISLVVYLSASTSQQYQIDAYLSQPNCGAEVAGTAKVHVGARVIYSYRNCSTLTFQQYDFIWINRNWVIRATAASTYHSDPETLLYFVNNYPY